MHQFCQALVAHDKFRLWFRIEKSCSWQNWKFKKRNPWTEFQKRLLVNLKTNWDDTWATIWIMLPALCAHDKMWENHWGSTIDQLGPSGIAWCIRIFYFCIPSCTHLSPKRWQKFNHHTALKRTSGLTFFLHLSMTSSTCWPWMWTFAKDCMKSLSKGKRIASPSDPFLPGRKRHGDHWPVMASYIGAFDSVGPAITRCFGLSHWGGGRNFH